MLNTRDKGGHMIRRISEENGVSDAFSTFIENSTITYLNIPSVAGHIFKCDLNPGIESPYLSTRYNTFQEPVTSIIVKMIYMMDNDIDAEKYKCASTYYTVLMKDEFMNEISLQTETFLLTVDNLNAVCPAVVFAKIIGEDESGILEPFQKDDGKIRKCIRPFLQVVEERDAPRIGIIGMEISPSMETLIKYIGNPNVKTYENMARIALLEIAKKTRYSHNDFHPNNILILPDNRTEYKDIPGSALIIDFGSAVLLEREQYEELTRAMDEKQFHRALTVLHGIVIARLERTRNTRIRLNYDWLVNTSGKSVEDFDADISALYDAKHEAIRENIARMSAVQLPLTEESPTYTALFKFQNIITGRGLKRKQTRKRRYKNKKTKKNKKNKKRRTRNNHLKKSR